MRQTPGRRAGESRSNGPTRLPADVLRSLLAASQRVGRGFHTRARWLADFANADLAGATADALDAWRWQALVWSLADPPDLEAAVATGARRATVQALTWSPLWHPHLAADDPHPVVVQLQRDLRGCLNGLLVDGRVLVKDAAGDPLLDRQADGTVTRRVIGDASVTFFTAVC